MKLVETIIKVILLKEISLKPPRDLYIAFLKNSIDSD